MKMRWLWSLCLLALLLVACVSSAALARSNAGRGGTLASYKQDLLGSSLTEVLLDDLLRMENEAAEEEEEPGRDGEEEARERRSHVDGALGALVGARERKAGCKNFFWKTFTSC
ncbi:somatostatin 1, tandem duplicate 1 [Corythoichthys intestinalis]|uniref:somatostatin 1, tandem duplicate 1 n=1 Tax=Corythoichthys intestinalis TaxID=161448 RepID=UPI0025A60962|nr:somatostatin 1, tandem duplicate 1 [Corythoichthys intestinalis]XP_061811907.1 somatostatin-1-like [Nerophis lumbriciformis]